ncbi:MAG TPA: 1-(5-phosphoribosyl)-5-amino-4-imidazole-carboxylate carboxylase, partial [Myxococcaceae bacterium]|nr:1-(5-phosphoribosyl)-5-amino-4-imidazole-carboxylate carboxylase [Myxococcaceae bacterium]
MDPTRLRKLLEDVKRGRATVDEAARALADLPFAELGYATVDTHRSVRFGFPEVVYGEGKSPEQLLGIVEVLVRRKQPVLVTRLSEELSAPLLARWPKARWHPE